MKFILRWIVTAIAVAAAVWLVPGIEIASTMETWAGVMILSLLLSLLNMSIKPLCRCLAFLFRF